MPWSKGQQDRFCRKIANRFRSAYSKNLGHTIIIPYTPSPGAYDVVTLRREIIEDYYDELEGLIDALVSKAT